MTFALNYKPVNFSFSATASKDLNIVVTWRSEGKHSVAAVQRRFTSFNVERTRRVLPGPSFLLLTEVAAKEKPNSHINKCVKQMRMVLKSPIRCFCFVHITAQIFDCPPTIQAELSFERLSAI